MKTIGDQKLKTVMDILLNDEVYFALYSLIERYNNFKEEHKQVSGYDGLNNITGKHALMQYEVWRDTLLIGSIQRSSGNESKSASITKYTTAHPENYLTSYQMVIQGNALATDICPISTYSADTSVYDKLGWYCGDFSITDEMEGELFQASTMYDVYSPYDLQEIMNRAMNLPLLKNDSLTILGTMMYHDTYKNLNQILRGY